MPSCDRLRSPDLRGRAPAGKAQHLRLEDASGALLGAVPCYLKEHSQGEYVFDHAWADAFERAGGRYYPKLQARYRSPPVTGPRLLAPRAGEESRRYPGRRLQQAG